MLKWKLSTLLQTNITSQQKSCVYKPMILAQENTKRASLDLKYRRECPLGSYSLFTSFLCLATLHLLLKPFQREIANYSLLKQITWWNIISLHEGRKDWESEEGGCKHSTCSCSLRSVWHCMCTNSLVTIPESPPPSVHRTLEGTPCLRSLIHTPVMGRLL